MAPVSCRAQLLLVAASVVAAGAACAAPGDPPPMSTGDAASPAADAASAADAAPAVDAAPGPDAPPGGGAAWDAWRYFRVITFDTTAAGAAVPGDVVAYPVAIALDADGFDFAQAGPGGADLRFSTPDGAELPHSVERWDPAAGAAAIWVRVDRIAGNRAAQSILMHWGNPDAGDDGDSGAVFATDDGFVAVWHLGEDGSTAAGHYRDATAHGAHATAVGQAAPTAVAGRVGNAVALVHDRRQWLRVDGAEANRRFDIHDRITYSLWVQARSHTVEYQCAFSKGETGFRAHYYGDASWDDNRGKHIVEPCVEHVGGDDLCPLKGGKSPWLGTDVAPGRWWHWVVVHDHPHIRFYLNGALEVEVDWGGDWTSSAARPVGLGNNTTWPDGRRSWDGYLDEVRVFDVVKDASWIKLDYESQREGQRFLRLGELQRRF